MAKPLTDKNRSPKTLFNA